MSSTVRDIGARFATVGIAIVLLLVVVAAQAQSVEQFYAGRQVKFYIGSAGGGGYDFYTRLVGPFGRHLTGNPLFVMQNMPGAGGVILANYLYNVAARDGSEIGMVARAAGTQPLIEPKDQGPRYVATRFNWIGTPRAGGWAFDRAAARAHSHARGPENA